MSTSFALVISHKYSVGNSIASCVAISYDYGLSLYRLTYKTVVKWFQSHIQNADIMYSKFAPGRPNHVMTWGLTICIQPWKGPSCKFEQSHGIWMIRWLLSGIQILFFMHKTFNGLLDLCSVGAHNIRIYPVNRNRSIHTSLLHALMIRHISWISTIQQMNLNSLRPSDAYMLR